jgi:hypothetical protein
MSARTAGAGELLRRALLVGGGGTAVAFIALDVAIRTVPGMERGLPIAVCGPAGVAGLALSALMAFGAVGRPRVRRSGPADGGHVARFREEWGSVLADMRWWERAGFVADLAVRGVPRLLFVRLVRRRTGSRS